MKIQLAPLVVVAFILAIPVHVDAAILASLDHDGTSADEADPFDTSVLNAGTDWQYTTDSGRSIMTALDNYDSNDGSGAADNRLITVAAANTAQFASDPSGQGWVFEIEFEILQGDGPGAGSEFDRAFANFGLRSENDNNGKQARIGLSNDGGSGDAGRIGFIGAGGLLDLSLTTNFDVDSLIGDGEYHNFQIRKYDNGTETVVELFLDGTSVLSTPYSSLPAPLGNDIQGFGSSTPTPLSEVNIDFINFTLYDNLLESAPQVVPVPGTLPLMLAGLFGLPLFFWRRRRVALTKIKRCASELT